LRGNRIGRFGHADRLTEGRIDVKNAWLRRRQRKKAGHNPRRDCALKTAILRAAV
jgi:hypothetical protein